MKRLNFWIDKLWQWLANNVLPTRLIYWAFIRGAAIATTEEYSDTVVSDLDVITALQRLDFKTNKEVRSQ